MAKRALKKKEDIAAAPLDQDIVIDLSDDPVATIVDDTGQPEKEQPVQRAEPPEPQGDDEELTTLKKQLEDLKAAEAAEATRRAELERQLQDERKRSQEFENRSTQHQSSELEAQYNSVLNAMEAADKEAESAAQAYDAAFQLGDGKAMAEAQRRISRAEAKLEALEQGKYSLESQREIIKTRPQRTETPDPSTMTPDQRLEANIAALPELAKNWIRGHREYMMEEKKYAHLQAAHYKAITQDIAPYSQTYLDFIEKELGLKMSNSGDEGSERNRTPVSAPVSRDTPSAITGKPLQQRVTLSAEERDMARQAMPNIDPGEAERIYAAQKLKLMEAKKNGHYTER